jgi:hypothetical protein
MRKLLTGLSLFALLFVTLSSLHAQTFTSQEGRFTVLFSGAPKQESQTIDLKGGGKTTLIQFSTESDNGNVAYMVMYNDYTGDYANGDPQVVLGSTRDGALTGKTMLSDMVINLNGVPGRAFTAKDKDYNYSVRQFLKGKRLYQLIVVSTDTHPATVADQFFSSFQMW